MDPPLIINGNTRVLWPPNGVSLKTLNGSRLAPRGPWTPVCVWTEERLGRFPFNKRTRNRSRTAFLRIVVDVVAVAVVLGLRADGVPARDAVRRRLGGEHGLGTAPGAPLGAARAERHRSDAA